MTTSSILACTSPRQDHPVVVLALTPSQLSRAREAKEPIGLQSNTPNRNTDVNAVYWRASTGIGMGLCNGQCAVVSSFVQMPPRA